MNSEQEGSNRYQRKPEWLKIRPGNNSETIAGIAAVEKTLNELGLNTVCDEAACPNRSECFGCRTATFMIMGRYCTRNCTFCNVEKQKPHPPNPDEAAHVAEAVEKLDLKHAVITSVTRDDLPMGGAECFSKVILEIRKRRGNKTTIEVLIPDFKGDLNALKAVADANPEIIAHNVETVPSLYPEVRPMAIYSRSLEVVKNIKALNSNIYSKSGIMLGLGEKEDEVMEVLSGLAAAGCDFLTIGQYLAPSKIHHPVVEYIHPSVFEHYKSAAYALGFKYVESTPFARSSFHAAKALEQIRGNSSPSCK